MRLTTSGSLRLSSRIALLAVVACAASVGCGSDDDDAPGSDAGDAGSAMDSGGSVSPSLDAGASVDGTVDGGSSTRDSGTAADAASDGTVADGGSDAAPAPDSGTDAADGADAADAADAAPAPLSGRAGTILFIQEQGGTIVGKGAAADFSQDGTYDDAGHGGTPECSEQAIDAVCVYRVCAPLLVDGGAPPAASQAGAVTIGGGSGFPVGGVVLMPNVADSYAVTSPATFDGTTVYMRGGDTLTYSAVGAVSAVGPFSVSLVAPADVAVTAPPIVEQNGADTTSITRSSDLTVAWTGGQAGSSVLVTVSTESETTVTLKSVVCTFPAGAGSGTVPSAGGLAKLDLTNGGTINGSFDLRPQTSATTTAGNAGGSASASDAWTITATAAGTTRTSSLTTR